MPAGFGLYPYFSEVVASGLTRLYAYIEALRAKKANNTYRRNTFYHIKEESAYTVLTHNTKQYTNKI
jgi:hypothetical protein